MVLACCVVAFAQEEKLPPDRIYWTQSPGCFSATLRKHLTITPTESVLEIEVFESGVRLINRYTKPGTPASYQAYKKRLLEKMPDDRLRALVGGFADGPDSYWISLREKGKNLIDWSWQYQYADINEELEEADQDELTRRGAERQTRAFAALMDKICGEVVATGRLESTKKPIESNP